MKVIKIALAFVFLCGFCSASLPDSFGYCSFMEYICNVRRCTTGFFKDLQKNSSAICSVKYRNMVECFRKVANDCVRGFLSPSQVDAIFTQKQFKESDFCVKGSFSVPESSSSVRLPCTSTYLQKATLCGKTFHQKFVANWSDPSLCSENAKAKRCVRDLLASECIINSKCGWELLNLIFGDYNPFCANNRDPGATGSDQCFGYLPGPTQSPTRPPTTLFYGLSTLPHEIFDAKMQRNKNDVISMKLYIVLFLLGLYFTLFYQKY